MGLTLEFYAGNAKTIIKAIRKIDLDALDEPTVVVARADFSFHLRPHDLNLLSRAIGQVAKHDPLDLRPYLDPVIDEIDHGVLRVSPEWIAYVVAAPVESAADIAADWVEQMRQEYHDPNIEVANHITRAIENLITLCKIASSRKLSVVHVWFL